MGTDYCDLPSFIFPVVAWAPEPATGDPFDDGTREFLKTRDVATIYFPKSDLRLGWTFVDAQGRSWEVVSSHVRGRADARWTWVLPDWIYHPRYRLVYEFVERPPVSFDAVKSRLFAAVTANPQAYPGDYAWSRRRQLRGAGSLADLIKPEEALAIERLEPTALWWQWLMFEGRASRLAFLAAFAGLLALWLAILWIGLNELTFVSMALVSGAFGMSAIIRRMHDLGLSGRWVVPWFVWTWLCGSIHDVFRDTGGPLIAGWLWWIPNLCIFGLLVLWPGTRGVNRYGYAGRKAQGSET